jgi:hypothetical protein
MMELFLHFAQLGEHHGVNSGSNIGEQARRRFYFESKREQARAGIGTLVRAALNLDDVFTGLQVLFCRNVNSEISSGPISDGTKSAAKPGGRSRISTARGWSCAVEASAI